MWKDVVSAHTEDMPMKHLLLFALLIVLSIAPVQPGPVSGSLWREFLLNPGEKKLYVVGFRGEEPAHVEAQGILNPDDGNSATQEEKIARARLLLRIYDRDGKLVVADGEAPKVEGDWEPVKPASYSIVVRNCGEERLKIRMWVASEASPL
jgi:hypothetical protein